jgi:hypothetical protein
MDWYYGIIFYKWKFITAGKIIELVLGDMINGPNVG